MRSTFFAATIAAVALVPSIAHAQQTNCDRQRSTQVVGTVAGAGVGGLVGNTVAGRGDKLLGTVIGAVAGGVIGNQVAKPSGDCRHAYGYYDTNSRWHATGVSSADARGFYDRDGQWVEGAPNGYYGDDNRWVQSASASGNAGSYNGQGEWVPASANGYYDRNDLWVARSNTSYRNNDQQRGTATAPGYYDRNGRWIAGMTTGHYDRSGRWVAGEAAEHRDASGQWVADAQPGYYGSDRRWHAGEATGYYDSRGTWTATGSGDIDQVRPHGARSITSQIDWLEQRARAENGSRYQGRMGRNSILRELTAIRTSESRMRHDRSGELSVRDEAAIQMRLDRVRVSMGLDASQR
jgi:hypothetical protein